MDIGECLTNIISTHEFTSIRCAYLEPTLNVPSTPLAIHQLVADWQNDGHLVAHDVGRGGLWLFDSGLSAEASSSILWRSMPPAGQVMKTTTVDLRVKHTDNYDFTALYEFWRASRESRNATTMKETTHKNFIAAQNATQKNNQASATNSAISVSDDAASTVPEKKGADQLSLLSIGDAHDHFLLAVTSSISAALCRRKGYVPLGARTLMIPKKGVLYAKPDGSGTGNGCPQTQLLTLDAEYTGGKVLVIKATLSDTEDLVQFGDSSSQLSTPITVSLGSILVLGPGGVIGKYAGTISTPGVSQPDSRALRSASADAVGRPSLSAWISRSADWLKTKGVNAEHLKGEPWLLVEIPRRGLLRELSLKKDDLDRPTIIPWPSSLCFLRQGKPPTKSMEEMPIMETADLLAFAQTWLVGEEERAQICFRRKQERAASEAASRSQLPGDADFQELAHLTSPLALRRSSLAGMVYPTPPDAVNVGIGATPTFEGNTSTPGPAFSHHNEPVDQSTSKGENDENEQMEDFRDHPGGSEFPDNSNNNNLFGEMGDDDLFGIDNGVTDADFSFFDQPDTGAALDDHTAVDEGLHHRKGSNTLEERDLQLSPTSMTNNDGAGVNDTTMGNTNGIQMAQAGFGAHDQMLQNDATQHAATYPEASNSLMDASPPLKPDTVFRRLSSIGDRTTLKAAQNRPAIHSDSHFLSCPLDETELTPTMSTIHEKYGPHGRFIYPMQSSSPVSIHTGIPTTNYFRRRRQRKLTARNNGSTFIPTTNTESSQHLDGKSVLLMDTYSLHSTPRSLSDVDESSDEESTVDTPGRNGKRKREIDDDGSLESEEDLMSASLYELKVDSDEVNSEEETLASVDVTRLDGDPASWSLAEYLAWPDSWANAPILKDTDFVAASRVLTDQASSRNFEYPWCHTTDQSEGLIASTQIYCAGTVQLDVLNVARQFMNLSEPCTLTSFLGIRGIPKTARPFRTPSRSTQHPNNQASCGTSMGLFEIPPPHLEVRRSDAKLTVLPAAVQFWDVLSLSPRSNSKDVNAICLYSAGFATEDEIEIFMENMRSAYESRRFGCHERLVLEGIPDGKMPMDLNQQARFSYDRGMSFIGEKLTEILKAVTSSDFSDRNNVIYFVYEPGDSSALVGVCAAFELVLSRYRLATAGRANPNELILQLVPRNIVASRTNPVVLSPGEYGNLSLEVYDRCYNFDLGWPSPSISIETAPRAIEFKPSATPSASPLQENSCLHIAYAQSIDDRWISVAWTDNAGNEQFTASYCLGRKGQPLSRQFQEVAHEIWETTLDLISSKKVQWRLLIVKCGPIEPHDTQFWCDLASTESKAHISLTVLTVDTSPSLQLIPPEIELPLAGMTTHSAFSSTPVSTPQGTSVLSPDSGIVSTPAEITTEVKIDPEATLLELSDQTYGAILGYEINDRNCFLDCRPTMLSGYVIKRAEHTPRLMQVNIIWDKNKAGLDRLMHEILTWYGGLATLARAKGVVDPGGDPRPWHIIVAERIVKAMYVLM